MVRHLLGALGKGSSVMALSHRRLDRSRMGAPGIEEKPFWEKEGGKIKIDPEWAPEIRPKHRKSLPNRRQQNPRGRREAPPPWGGAEGAALLSSIWYLRISYVFASFPEPILGRFWFFHLLFSGKGFSTFLAPPTLCKGWVVVHITSSCSRNRLTRPQVDLNGVGQPPENLHKIG